MKLAQIATISLGHPFRRGMREVKSSGILAVQMKDVTPWSGVHWENCSEVAVDQGRKVDWLQPGDILLTARGNTTYAALVSPPKTAEMPLAVAMPYFYVIRCKLQQVLPEYLVWWLNHGPSQRHFNQHAEGTLTKSIRRSGLEDTPVAVPSIQKQQAVIELVRTIRSEQLVLERMQTSTVNLMNALAGELLEDKEVA